MSKYDSGKGLQHAKAWVIELSRCKAKAADGIDSMTPAVKLLGCVIREHFHTKTGTVYVGTDTLAELTGEKYRGTVSERRSVLVKRGWLTDTGEKRGRTPLYRLTIPECGCGKHGARTEVPDTEEPETDAGDFLSLEQEADLARWEAEQEPALVPAKVPEATRNPLGFNDEPPF